MSYSDFILAFKSTLDYKAKQVADSLGLPFLDLASVFTESDLAESDQPLICWEFSSIGEFPQDPMWYAEFEIGAITTLDPSQYISLDIIGEISDHFKPGVTIDIKDYSGTTVPETKQGVILVTATGVSPQQADRSSGIRFVTISARATRE